MLSYPHNDKRKRGHFMDYVILGIIVLAVCLAIYYIVKSKKNGKKCIGCPYSDGCGGSCSGKPKASDKENAKNK